jgi:hypothetical protein
MQNTRIKYILLFLFIITTMFSQKKLYPKDTILTYLFEIKENNSPYKFLDTVKLEIYTNKWKGKDSIQNLACWKYKNLNYEKECIGIIDNEKWLFLHPPRVEQFIVLEGCPFPSLSLPLYKGLSSKGVTVVPNNTPEYGDFQGTKIYTKQKVVEKVDFIFADLKIESWKIIAKTKHVNGRSSLVYYFNPKYGILSMEYLVSKKLSYKFTLLP